MAGYRPGGSAGLWIACAGRSLVENGFSPMLHFCVLTSDVHSLTTGGRYVSHSMGIEAPAGPVSPSEI